jgi:glycosyltransferase involved in cell wall biosynthesis
MVVKRLVFIGSHLGYPMDRTPLGGGAMVGLQLLRHWPIRPDYELTAVGSGSMPPRPGLDYVHLPQGEKADLVRLSELGYAAFCRRFEKATTDWLLARRERFDPASTCVLVNDISEGPALARLTQAGYPIVSIWHVDVVDYFNKLYLRHFVAPERLTRLYERSLRWGVDWVAPDVLRLIFDKQRETVLHSHRMIFPSRAMAETVKRCYGELLKSPEEFENRSVIVPWGVWKSEGGSEEQASAAAARLRAHYKIGPETMVVMTLSRISPEKGLHLLLEGLRLAEEGLGGRDVCLLLCGEPAFMQGERYFRKVKEAAARLKRVRVFFPGYLDPAGKKAHFRLAQLFVSPSIHESYGLNMVEAMQAGLAILASDHYGVRDILEESFGRPVHYPSAAKAPALLAQALKELLGDRERLRLMGRAAAAAAREMPFSAAAATVLDTCLGMIKAPSSARRAVV